MSNELISKKELLTLTGISYGQLYRWKRKDLIPEDWFIRKSTFTGQETFFPKAEILERISKIQTMKENVSLDELAGIFSPDDKNYKFNKEELLGKKIVSEPVVNYYLENAKIYQEIFDFDNILPMFMMENQLQSGAINLDEGKMMIQLYQDYYLPAESKKMVMILTRKMGVSSCVIADKTDLIHFDDNTKVVSRIDLEKDSQELKSRLSN